MVLGEGVQEVVQAWLIGIEMRILINNPDFFIFYACDYDVGCLGEGNRS